MLKQLLEILGRLFGTLTTDPKTPDTKDKDKDTNTGTPDKDTGTTTTPDTTSDTVDEELISDSSDLPRDTVIIEGELPFEIEDGKITPIEDEDDNTDSDSTSDTNTDTTGDTTTDDIIDVIEDTDDTTNTDDGVVTEPKEAHKARFMWCLDNGHGENTPGKRSPEFELDGITVQFFEYEFNRDIVGRIIAGLRERGVSFTNIVSEITDISLQDRTIRANRIHRNGRLPVIYVSVHSNAAQPAPGSNWTPANGIETWHHKNSTNGKKIAGVFQKHLIQATGWRNRKLKTTKLRNLYVLNKTAMPAILTENGFFNNKEEVKKLMRDDVRQAIADAHIAAIWEIEKNGIV